MEAGSSCCGWGEAKKEKEEEKKRKNGERPNKMREVGQGCEGHTRDEGVKESVTRRMKSMTLPQLTSLRRSAKTQSCHGGRKDSMSSEVSSEEKEEEEEEEEEDMPKDQSRDNRKKESVDTERRSGYIVLDKPNDCAREAQQLPEALGKMSKMQPAVQACKELLQVCNNTTPQMSFFLPLHCRCLFSCPPLFLMSC